MSTQRSEAVSLTPWTGDLIIKNEIYDYYRHASRLFRTVYTEILEPSPKLKAANWYIVMVTNNFSNLTIDTDRESTRRYRSFENHQELGG